MTRAGGASPSLQRFAWLSIAAAIATISLKSAAYYLTGSVGLLSDALESVVNLVAAVTALALLALAERPPDDDHPFGHTKAEYFASAVEGALILVAALGIAATAVERLIHPHPLERVGLGLAISVVASSINLGVARVLARVGRRWGSITLEADAQHLMTDVWTTLGVLVGVAAVQLTGWLALDPIIALLVALNIVWAGIRLVGRSATGLMDSAIPVPERQRVEQVLARFAGEGVEFHSLRTRQAGRRRFIAVHVLVPGEWSVQRGHDLLEEIERDVREAMPGPTTVMTHLEPIEDPASHADKGIDR